MKSAPHNRTAWSRLTSTARLAPPTDDTVTIPVGFATRVVALAQERAPTLTSLYELLSWRALAAATLIAVAAVATNLSSVLAPTETDAIAVGDPVAEVLALT